MLVLLCVKGIVIYVVWFIQCCRLVCCCKLDFSFISKAIHFIYFITLHYIITVWYKLITSLLPPILMSKTCFGLSCEKGLQAACTTAESFVFVFAVYQGDMNIDVRAAVLDTHTRYKYIY